MKRLLLCAAFLMTALPVTAQVEGVGYRLNPIGEYTIWHDDATLTDGLTYGGSAGISFGEFVELGGLYLLGNDFETDFQDFGGLDDVTLSGDLADLASRDVDMRRYGGELKLNLGTGTVVPFIQGGAGVLRFNPQGISPSENIFLMGGGGLQLSLADRYTVTLAAQNLAFRYNPGTTFFTSDDLAAIGAEYEDFGETTVNNLALRASLQLYLGGRRPGDLSDIDRAYLNQFSGGLSGLNLQIEPTYGTIQFDDALPYRDQRFVGGQAGFDFGSLVGLRGFYARGVEEDDPTAFQDVQTYGGLARFRLSDSDGLTPFITLGGGYYDVRGDYATEGDTTLTGVEDKYYGLGGAGLEIPFSNRFRLTGEARAMLMSNDDPEDISRPSEIAISPMFKAGVAFALGGSSGDAPNVVREERFRDVESEREALAREREELRRERERLQEELTRTRTEAEERIAQLQSRIERARAEGDSATVARLESERAVEEARSRSAEESINRSTGVQPVRTPDGDRIVTIPLPEQGEVYIRYGEPGGVQIESEYEVEERSAPRKQHSQGQARQVPQHELRAVPPPPPPPQAERMSEEEIRRSVREALQEVMRSQQDNANAQIDEERYRQLERRLDEILLRDATGGNQGDDVSGNELRDAERRLEDRLSDEIRALRAEVAALREDDDESIIITDVEDGRTRVRQTNSNEVSAESGVLRLLPIAGFSLGDGPERFLAGLRADYRSAVTPALRYYPEFYLGLGSTTSYTFNINGAFRIPGFPAADENGLTPYAGVGLGVTGFTDDGDPEEGEEGLPGADFTVNVLAGAEFDIGRANLFGEFNTGNFGSYNRLLVGYRVPIN